METVNVRQLKNNPSEALRKAKKEMVLVMNRDQPDALLVHLDKKGLLDMPGVKTALATALFKEGNLSLGRAAKLAEMAVGDFMQHLSRLGVSIVSGTKEEVTQDMNTLKAWIK